MNALLYRTAFDYHRCGSLQTFAEYREAEAANLLKASVSVDGSLLEYETLELRVHPPNVEILNDPDESATVITVDSANRAGTLVEVRCHYWFCALKGALTCCQLARLFSA